MARNRLGRGCSSWLMIVTLIGCLTILLNKWTGQGFEPESAPQAADSAPTAQLSTKAPVTRFRISTKDRSREYVERVIRTHGYYIPPGDMDGAPHFVTDDDIKATLKFVDQHLSVQKETSDPATYWNTTRQKQLMIVTTWRSGSTLMGEILAHHPTVFYHYEPLKFVGRHRFRAGRQGQVAVSLLKGLLSCNYSNADYINKVKRDTEDMIGRNLQVWPSCTKSPNGNTCREPAFLRSACKRFPFVTVKTVRLRLDLTRNLLEELPDLKIVYLVRDPRAVMNSRYQLLNWCGLQADCIDPVRLCQDISDDLKAFRNLSLSNPNRLMLIQYETLASRPLQTFESLFEFAGLTVLPSIRKSIENHTSIHQEGARSTFHKSVDRITLWKSKLSRKQIDHIQSVCSSALELLGYPLV